MIKYRVEIKVRYNSAFFDFDTIESAGEFAKTALMHRASFGEDYTDFEGVNIEVVDTSRESEDEE